MPLPPPLYDDDEPAFRQDAHMLGDGRLAHAEIFRHGIQGKRLPCQHPEHGPPRRIGNGLKDISSRFHAIENYTKPFGLVKVWLTIRFTNFYLYTVPPFMTKETLSSALMSFSGSAATAMISA